MGKAIIDFIRWAGGKDYLAYRHPAANISKYAKLQVNDAQEAVVIVNGTKSQKFGPGQYNMDSPNFPILRAFYGIPFGGENPWTVQAWFVSKLTPKDVEWSIEGFPIYDPNFQAQIPVRAYGRYGIVVKDAEKFIIKLALGYASSPESEVTVTVDQFTDQLAGELNAKAKSLISRVFSSNGYGINQIAAHLEDISTMLERELCSFYEEFGCELSKFYVTSIDIDTSTEAGRIAQDAINQQTHQKISGHTWQQGKMFETAQQAVNNANGTGGGIMSAVMMAGMFGAMGGNGGAMSQMMNPQYGQPAPAPYGSGHPGAGNQGYPGGNQGYPGANQGQPVREVYCSRCSKKFRSDNRFCPFCGDPYNPCPRCGADNDTNASRCVTCGAPLNSANIDLCPGCNSPIAPGAAFCPTCGRPLSENKCPRCGNPSNGSMFCPSCGMKLK